MGNYFDKFDGDKPSWGGNFFDQFDDPIAGAKPTATDYLKGAASGVGGLVSGIGYLAERAGANQVGGDLRFAGDEAQKAFTKSMTPAGQRAAQSQVFEDDPGAALPKVGDRWGQALAMGAAQSAPSMVAAALPGGIAAMGLRGAAGMAASRGIGGALAPLAAGTAAPIGGWATNLAGNLAARVPTALGFGAAEGAVAGASNAAQWKSDIEQRPEQELDALPGYAQLKAQIGPEAARQQIAEQGAADIMARTTLATGGIGALTGGGALASAFQRVTTGAKGGIAGAIGRDVAKEAGQEIPQSGAERTVQNLATRDYLDPNQPVSQGVAADALSGGAIGGLMGGVTGGASHLAKGPLQKAVEAGSATTPSTDLQTAGISAGNTQPATDGRAAAARDLVQAAAEQESEPLPRAGSLATAPQGAAVPSSQGVAAEIAPDLPQNAANLPQTFGNQNTPAAPGTLTDPVSTAAPSLPANQAEPAGVHVSQLQEGAAPRGNETEIAKPAAPGRQAQPTSVSGPAGTVGNTGTQPAPTPPGQDVNLQNRDRSRAASVLQMSEIARNPDYLRLGPSRTPDSGAPMVFAVGDDSSRIPAMNFGNHDVAVMSDGQRVPFRYAVADASQVEPSHFADGRVNPAFVSSQTGTIKALNNGRTAGLRAAYEIGSAGAYQTDLAKDLANVGLSPDVLQRTPNPILVRVYSDSANTAGMAAKSQAQGLGMSPAELARQDAPLLDSSVLELFQPGDVASAGNRDFVRAFVGKLQQSGQDIAGMMTDAGTLSPMGRQRIQAALMQAAYGEADLVAELFDSIDTDIKAIGEALKAASGAWANMRDSARIGAIAPEVDITGNLVAAVRLIQKARRDGTSLFDLVNQRDIETGETVDDLTAEALRLFYTGKFLTRAVGKEKLVSDLEKYLLLASATSSGADMFGERVEARKLLQAITRDSADEGLQGKRKPAGVPPAGPGSGGAGQGGPGRRGASGGGTATQSGGRGGRQGEGGQEAVIVPPAASAATLSYEEFSKQYRDAFANAMRYSPNEVGAAVFTERMAKLADDYPEFLARLEAEEDGKARTALALRGQTPEEVAAAEAEAVAAADKEAKARQDAEKARKDAEDRAEIKRRSDGAAQSFELGGDAMANLSGQGDMFGGPPAAAAPSREPTSNAGELPPGANTASDDLGALFDAELDAAFTKPKEKGNEPGSVRNSQRDREAADAQQGDEGALSDERGRESATPGGGVPIPDANSRGGRPGGSGVSGAGAASGGERGDQPVPGTKRPAGVEKLPAGDNQRQGSPDVRPGGVAASGGESAAAVGRPAGGGVGPRSASEAAKSAAKNAGLALSDVAKGLNALFKPRPGTLGSGPSFDEDTYAAAKPYFQAGLAHFRQAGADIVEMMRALIAALRDQFGMDKDTIAAMKPYVLRYISDVKAGREAIDETSPQELKKDKLQQQREAEPIKVIVGDKANIDATLPFLTEGQREDVLFAENRWAAPDGYGVLFTNGTGTGKTFLALGAIKRLTKQGKGNGIVVVPNEAVMNEWVKSAPALGLQIKPLTDTKDAGSGIAITTYKNFGENDEIAKRDYDFVAIDEAHLLMLGKDAEPTQALRALRAVSLHPDGVLQRAEMQNRGLVDRIERTRKEIDSITRSVSSLDTMQQVLEAAQRRVDALSKELDADVKEWRAILERTKADVMARQDEKRSRVMFLSATPFAYEPSIQWGEGFLYDFPEVSGRGYNAPNGYQKFMMQHFGWRMRNGKLTQPPAEVDSDLMQRQFNTWLRKEGVLSARMLDVDHDYERKFILIQGGAGQTIDDGLRWLRETDNGRYWSLYHAINEKFDYLTRSRLLEAIKARAAIPYIKKHHALGRKVVVFYDFNSGGGINVFNLSEQLKQAEAAERMSGYDVQKDGVDVPARGQGAAAYGQIKTERVPRSQLIREFMAARPELQAIDFSQYGSPLTTLLQAFPGAGVYNGMGQYKKTRVQSIRDFNDDAKPEANLLLVQKTANAGWSGHDTTGKHGRVVINLGLPVAPIEAIQQEGRIYRVGQKSDANFQYFNTGTNWERYAFGSKIARRAGTAENLAMGEQARGLREAFIQAFENSDPDYEPGEADGRGGKLGDRDLVSAITEWDRARSLYFAQQKKTARTKAAEGEDYYATPEPLGLKMVEWAGILPGDRVLEPSAGHGAIARWFPDKNDRTVIEPSLELASRLTLATDAKLANERFENHDTINKYDAIVMNPPFGTGGKTAIEHLDKALRHLTDGGRVVALIPEGPAANKRFDDWLYGDKQVKAKPVTSNLGTFGAVFLGDTATVEVSGLAGIAGGVLGASTVTGKVTGFREGKLFVQREGDAWATGYRPDQIRAVQPTGARTVTVQSAPAAYLRASIGLPGVTFERAGTAVKTRVVIIDKITEQSRLKGLRTQDSREIEAASIKELFERIENMSVVGRSLPADKARVQKQEADRDFAKAANAGKMDDAGIVQPSGAPATVESIQEPEKPGDPRKLLTDAPRVEHVTKAGKTIFGVIAKRLTKDQARSIDPYMRARDGGFFIRMAHVVRPASVAEQERAVYNVNEPDGITGDLFRGATPDLFAGTDHALPAAARTNLPGERAAPARTARPAPGPAARVLAVRQAQDAPGLYHVSTQLVTVGERELPVERIRTTEDAAKAFAYLPRWAVEHYDAIVTDKDGKPLAIIGGFKGGTTQTSVSPATVVAELSRIDGAKNLWAAHNHPSGLAVLSNADRNLDREFATILEGAGVNYHGLFALVGARAGVVKYDHTIFGAGQAKQPRKGLLRIPMVERELTDRREDVDRILGPESAKDLVSKIAGETPGIVFLDAQNGIVAFTPFRGDEMGSLRRDGRLMRLFRSASQANAVAAIVANPNGEVLPDQIANLVNALGNIEVSTHDVIGYSTTKPSSAITSMAEAGSMPSRGIGSKVVFSAASTVVAASPSDRAVYEMAAEGKSAAEILSFLSKASRRPFNRVLANALQKAGLQTTVTADSQGGWQFGNRSYAQRYAAAYSPRSDAVALFTPREAERHFLHELVHAATLKAIESGGVSAMRLRALFNHVQKSGKLDGQYGMTSLDEFVAEAFSNPKFRDALQNVPAPASSALKSAWQWFVRIVARIVGIKTQAAETALDRALREGVALMEENAAIRAKAAGADRYAIAWHGTPHVWPPEQGFPHGRPRLDKIGSGEGAQAYGWGWYSAEAQRVASSYSTAPGAAFSVAGKTYAQLQNEWFDLPKPDRRAITALADSAGNAAEALSNLEDQISPESKQAADLLRGWIADGKVKALKGTVYQLDLPDDVLPRLLDWDKPLSEQSPAVQEALRGSAIAPDESTWQHWTGQQLYEGEVRARTEFDGQAKGDARKLTSEQLASIGIPGLRYLDGQSRNRPIKDIKREFLAELPEDAEFDEVSDLIGTGRFSPKNEALISALMEDDWLGFDYPSQAISAALSKDLSGYDASPKLLRAVESAKEGGTYNYVIWDQSTLDRISLLERNGEKLDAIRAADEAVRFNVADDLPPTITINGVERPTTNSNGKPIHPTLEGVRNFYAWFKDSKVVDEQGRPLILFHGATADFGVDGAPVVFDFGRTADENLSSGKGAYLTTSPEAASRYANGISWGNGGQSDAPNVMPVYARIEAPFSKAATYRVSDFESVLPESVIDSAKEDANPSENFLEETQQAIEDMQRKIFDLQDGYLNNEIAEEYRIEESDYEDSDEYEAAIEDAVESEIASLERSVARYESEIERAWSDAKKDYANTRMTGAEIWDAIKEDLPEYTDWKNERRLIGGDTASIEMDTEVARILFDAFGFDGVKRTDKFPIRTQHAVYIANNSPTQVKSATGNRGTFDATDPDIRYNVSGTQPAVTPPPSPGNLWQSAKAKAAALLAPGRIDKLIYELQDKYVDLRRIRDHIRSIGGTITDLNDAYLGEELYHKRLAHRTQDFLKAELRPLLADMKARSVGMEELESFLHARHAPEANAEMAKRNPNQAEIDAGRRKAAAVVHQLERNLQTAQARGLATRAIEQALNDARGDLVKWNGAQAFSGSEQERRSLSGMTDQAAAAIMAGLSPQRRADLDALATKVDAINSGTLQLLDDYGLMSKASLDEWRNKYQHYIPLHRDEAHPDSANHPIGKGFSVKGDAAKRRTGSNQKVTHILGHIAMQREAALTRGEKNRVMLKLYLMARQNPLPDVWKVGTVPMLDTIDHATGFVKSVPDPLYRTRPNVVTLRISGKDVAITMNEHNPQALRMAQALKNLDVDDLHYLIPIVGRVTRWFAAINTQYNPIFGVINLMRDIQGAALNLSTTELAGKQGKIFKDQLSILGGVLKNKGRMPTTGPWAALFEEFNAVGGTTGYRDLYLHAEDRAEALLDELKALDRGQASKAAHAIADWLSDYNEAMENATRLAAYKAALDQGLSKERAASLAKNLTVNFNRKGRQTRELGAFYAFLNASIQGTTRLAQTLAGPAGRKIMAGGVALGALSTLLGIAMMGGGDDDEWSKIPEFVKERSLIIPISKDQYLALPMPLGFHFLPNIGRLAVEMAFYKGKTAGSQMASLFTVLADAFNPLGGSAPVAQIAAPTVLDPVAALLQNKDWTGKPIYIESFNKLNPEPGLKRAKDSATPWAKGFAEAINAITGGTEYTPGGWSPTPDQIDYVIGQLTGGLGREASKVAATASAPFTGEELPPYRIPLLGRLYGNTRGTSGQSEAFYENIRQANAAESEIKGRLKDGVGIADFLKENPHALDLAALGNAAERQVRELRGIRRGIVNRGEPDAVSKAREVNERMAAVMRGFNKQAERMQ